MTKQRACQLIKPTCTLHGNHDGYWLAGAISARATSLAAPCTQHWLSARLAKVVLIWCQCNVKCIPQRDVISPCQRHVHRCLRQESNAAKTQTGSGCTHQKSDGCTIGGIVTDRASTQRSLSGVSSLFQNGARCFLRIHDEYADDSNGQLGSRPFDLHIVLLSSERRPGQPRVATRCRSV